MEESLIFGVNGQDGSYLSELLLDKGYRVIGVVRRSSVNTLERIEHLLDHKNFHVVEGDVTDQWSVVGLITKLIADSPEVYNLAAQSHVGTSFAQPHLTWNVTATGPLNILEALVRFKPKARFYQASSSEMFGSECDISLEDENFGKYQDENTYFSPQSPYAIAKLAAHHAVGVYRKAYKLHASSGILFNHESPRRGDNFVTKKITNYIKELRSNATYMLGRDEPLIHLPPGGKLRLGNLDASRDWGHARDYVRAMWLMLQQPEADDYVIATGETHTVREFLDIAFKSIGISDWKPFVEIDPTLFRPAEVPYLRGSYAKANQKFGWQPDTTFEELVQEMLLDEETEACEAEF